MLKINVEPIAPRIFNNRTFHSDYLRLTQKQAVILKEVVEQGKSQNPLNNYLDHVLGNACPLTRITTTTEVPLRKPTALETDASKPVVTLVYSRKPRKSKTNVPVIKPKIIKSLSANNKEPSKSWGSIVFDVPFSTLDECRNDHLAMIMGYGDYQIGNVMISKKQLLPYVTPKTVPSYVFATAKHHMSFYMTNFLTYHSFMCLVLCYPTNDGENLGKLQSKADIGIFIGYAPIKKEFQIYNRRTRRIIKTIHVDFDELTVMASKHSCLEPTLHEITPTTISSGLMPNPPPSTLYVPPSRSNWYILFQPLFDELLTPPPSVDPLAPEVIALIAEVVASAPAASIGSSFSTTVDQKAPSTSNSQTTPETQSPVISNDVKEENHELDVAHTNNDLFFGILVLENDSKSSSLDVIPTVVHTTAPNSEHVTK
nr:hypothetical protein [Tanacetum cinerariifolium]